MLLMQIYVMMHPNRFGQDANHRIDPTYSFGFS